MIIKKASDGNYYVSRMRGSTKGSGKYQDKLYKNTFFITKRKIFKINFPKKFHGKTIRLKVEIVKNKKNFIKGNKLNKSDIKELKRKRKHPPHPPKEKENAKSSG